MEGLLLLKLYTMSSGQVVCFRPTVVWIKNHMTLHITQGHNISLNG